MIIVELAGGMGNQMFQYAIGKYLATKHKTELKIDLNFFKTYDWHEYSLGPLNIKETIATDKEISWLKGEYFQSRPERLFGIRKKLAHISHITEKSLQFDQNYLDLPNNIYLQGFWQSENYFSQISDKIREEFNVKKDPSNANNAFLTQILSYNSSVSLHIRRGNYANLPEVTKFHGLCSMEYYSNAIDLINSKVSNPCYFIFSDDITWVKDNLKIQNDHVFIDSNNDKSDYEDMRLMRACKHNIIANSTFSWWGAWLGSNENKIVIAPKIWFADQTKKIDIIPKRWIKL
ncbi:MAG: alpha-1,2-fucosyltransferase [Opitutaceae bacterium]|nr:alpha-1,2-fucosyltransferase [Cytophagales bacterium]